MTYYNFISKVRLLAKNINQKLYTERLSYTLFKYIKQY